MRNVCRRCRQDPATHSATLRVSKLTGKPGGSPVVSAKGSLCETCAVEVYQAVAKAVAA